MTDGSMTDTLDLVAQSRCHGGIQSVFRHVSAVCGTEMTFGVYLPPQAARRPVPVLWYLSGLTCTHENAMVKAGLQAHAAKAGIALVFPDTSPRGPGVPDDGAYDLGQGAGFYVNATREPWRSHYQMYDYVTRELRGVVQAALPVSDAHGITGHSMGGPTSAGSVTSSSTRGPTTSSSISCGPRRWPRSWPAAASRGCSGCRRDTTTATSSSRASARTTSTGTPSGCSPPERREERQEWGCKRDDTGSWRWRLPWCLW